MGMMKWRTAAVVALGVALVSRGWAGPPGPAADDRELAAWVEKRVEAWQPAPEARRRDTIGWAGSIREAERLAREHGRAVFLFTYDGASLANYRC